MQNKPSDVIIIGAGPSGAATSLFLAKEKIPHTIIDKNVFPRDKICGDALSGKVVSVLNKLNPNLVSELNSMPNEYIGSWGVKFVAPNGNGIDIPFSRDPSKLAHAPGFISKRINFDNFLAERLDKQFADIRLETEVTNITRSSTGIELSIKTNGTTETLHPKIVIGADGDRTIVAKQLANRQKDLEHYCAGLRVYYEGVTGMHNQNFIELHFLKKVLPGYFWIFPLPNGQANIGLGMLSSVVSKKKLNLKQMLVDIIENDPTVKHRFISAKPLEKIQGWGLPMGSVKRKISGDGYLLLGDAASLIDPFTGEGIGNGMLSGMLAARHIKSALEANRFDAEFLAPYDAEIYKKMWAELKLSHTMQKMVQYPWILNFLINKARKNKALQEMGISMFEDLNIRAQLKDPKFYFKLLFN